MKYGADARTQVKLVGSAARVGCPGQVFARVKFHYVSVFTHNKFGSDLIFRQMGANVSITHLILSKQKKLTPLCLILS